MAGGKIRYGIEVEHEAAALANCAIRLAEVVVAAMFIVSKRTALQVRQTFVAVWLGLKVVD
jgi:hypothetical protein